MNFPLDPQQQRAVYFQDGNALISACPGSGKTRVLSCKAAHLLDVNRERLVAVTFTRDSAAELRRRILEMCKINPRHRLLTGTFHGLALNQFSRSGRKIRVLGAGEQITIMYRVWEKTGRIDGLTFEDAKEGVDTIKSSLDQAPSVDTPIGSFFKAYQETLVSMGVHDFADLMIQSVMLMRAGDLAPFPCESMLVDEAQDMDEVQYAWIACHANAGTKVTIVGDDDQSIYGWRCAMGYDGMMRFKSQFDAAHLSLFTNYRSCAEIINVATNLVSHNKSRVEKAIRPYIDTVGQVQVIKAPSRKDEADLLVKAVKEEGPEGWVVLARTNRLLDLVEVSLCAAKIPCRRIGGKNFWEGQEPSVFLGLLKSLSQGDGVGELLALHWAGISKDLLDTVKNGSTCWAEIVGHLAKLPDHKLDKGGQKIVSTFLSRRRDWGEALRLGRYRLVISGVAAWCRGFIKDDRQKGNKETLEARADIFQLCESALNRMKGSLDQRIFTLTQAYSKRGEDAEGVQLMTIHNSKGLEYPRVWVVAVEENTLPHVDANVEEERRLCYVAMTRAKQHLTLSYCGQDTSPSRFLLEAGIAPRF